MADRIVDLGAQREHRDDRSPDDELDLVEKGLDCSGSSVATRGSRHRNAGERERQDPQATGVGLAEEPHRGFVAGPFAEVDERGIELDRKHCGELDLVEDAVLAQDLAEALSSLPLGRERASSWTSVMRPAFSSRSPIRRGGAGVIDMGAIGVEFVRAEAGSASGPASTSSAGSRRHERLDVGHQAIPGQSSPATCRPARAAVAAPTARAGANGSGSRRLEPAEADQQETDGGADREGDEDGNEHARPAGHEPDEGRELDVAAAHGALADHRESDEETGCCEAREHEAPPCPIGRMNATSSATPIAG